MAVQPVLLIVVDRREFALRCMSAWLSGFRREFAVTSVLDVDKSLRPNEIARARAVIIGAAAPSLPNPWLEKQVAWLFARRADIPIVAITDAGEADEGGTFAAALNLRGHISTSTSTDVAAAALRLVVAGGTYLPHQPKMQIGQGAPPVRLEIPEEKSLDLLRTLTPRERGVLELLERGMANKMIAYRLNMSSSTVKVHIHNIMVKLNAHNRTEAAVAAARFVNLAAATDFEAKPPNETALRLLLEAPSAPRAPPAKRSLAIPIDDGLPSLLPIEPRSVEDAK